MNRIYTTVWNQITQAFVVVSEHAKRRGKRSGGSRRQHGIKNIQCQRQLQGLGILVLEPRIMFDGAALATAIDVAHNAAADNHAADVAKPAPTALVKPPVAVAPEAQVSTTTNLHLITDSAASNSVSATEVLVVDSRIPDYQQIVGAAKPGTMVIVLDLNTDGVKQIADAVQGMHGIESISIVSHGDEGLLLLGNGPLFSGNLDAHAADLKIIGNALSANGDILLYGCDVGAGSDGKAFLDSLAAVTSADVAASTDNTGGTSRGGNWDLEISTGAIDYPAALDTAQLTGYDHLLVTSSVGNVTQLKAAIATGNTDGVDDVITLTGNITFGSASDAITINVSDGHTMSIVGGGFMLSGGNYARVLNISTSNAGSAVSIDNLTITNGLAVGAGGSNNTNGVGAPGSDGLGGGIFNAGVLTITNSIITANKASGGGGGGGTTTGLYGGGGGGGGGFGSGNAGAGGLGAGNQSAGAISGITGGTGGGAGGRGGSGGSATGGAGSTYSGTGYSTGGSGGTANNGSIGIGGGGGGDGTNRAGGGGGNAVGGIYNASTGVLTITASSITNNIGAGGGGGGGGSQNYASSGNGGNGGVGIGGIWNKGGIVNLDSATNTSLSTGNLGAAGHKGLASGGSNVNGNDGTATATLTTTNGGSQNTSYSPLNVTSVNSSTTNGTYKIGDTVSVQVNFSAAVTVTGTPQLTLETGTTDRVINYASGSGTSTLTFTYTVQAGDTSTDLDYQSTSALALNSGTIKNGGTDAVLTLAAPGAANSLGNNKAIVIDGVVPTVTSVNSSTSNGTYKVGDTVSVQVNFSEAVTVTGTPQLTLETGTTDRIVNYASGSGTSALTFTYTVQAGDTSADLDYQSTTALALNSGTIKDSAGNAGTLTLASPGASNSLGNNKAIVIDGVVPTVTSVNSSTTNGTYKTGDTVSVQVNFSEAVTVTGTPQLTLETGTTDRVVNYASGSGTSTLTFTYTVQAGDTSADLDYQSTTALALNGGTIKDAAGNAGTLTLASPGAANSLGNNKALVIDATPVISNLNGDSTAWAGIGSTVVLDASADASLSDTEFGALNSGNGNWAGASLTVQRSGIAITADTLGFNTSGALFTVSGSNLQSGGLTFATFTNASGVLTITYTSSGTAATTALVNDVAQRITYRNDTPSGDATLRFALSDGTASTTADVTVASDSIYVTNSTDTATIDLTNGVSFSEAIGIAAADVTGSQTIVFASSLGSTALAVNSVTLSESLTFDMDAANGMSLTTGSITINGGTTLTLSNGAGHTATISSAMGGASGALTKAGAGTVTLSNTNSYTGATTVSAGTLAVSVSNAIATGSSVSVAVGATWSLSANQLVGNLSGAGSINLGSSTLSTRLTADSTFSGGISGTGAFNVNQTGAATFALTLSGTNTFTGATTLQNFAWLKLDGDAAYSDSSALRVNGNSRLTLLSDQTVGSIASSVSTASLNLGSFTLSAGGDNTNTIVAGAISGTGALTKLGTGTLTLSGTNTYTGITTVSTGSLALVSGTAIADTDAVTVASGATLNVAASETIGSLAGAGSVTLGASTLTTGGNNTSTSFSGGMSGSSGALTKTGSGTFSLSGTNSYTGATLVSGGTLSIASDSNLGAGTVTLATGTTLVLTAVTNVDNAIALSGNAAVTASANATLSGNITGAGGLTKSGTSSLTLSGTDGFTGATSVSAGTLIVNGALSGTSGMTIVSGGTLGGSGSIFAGSSTNTLTVQSGGTLSPGNGAAATITVNGNLSMASGSTLAVDINGATAGTGYDQIIVNGTVAVSGATLAATHGYTAASGDTYNILVNDAADSITGNFSGLSEGGTLIAGGDSVQLTGSYIGGTGNDFSLTAPVFPSVTSISTSTPDGTYKIGDTITLVVNFSEAVHLTTGTIQLTLETGTVDRAISYQAGSGTSTLYFNYTVQPGDHSLDLDYTSTTALNANGDTIQGGSFQDAILTLATPGASGSLGAGAALVVDGVAPAVSSIVVADNSLTVGQTSLVTITFSEAVTGFTNADLTVANGTLTAVTTGDGGVTWTATLTPTASTTDATNLITLANTGVQDVAGNAGTGSTDSNNYAIDTARPSATIVVADNSLIVGETSAVTITFSEAVTGFSNADLTIANGTLSAVNSADGGITWTATLTPTASTTDTTNLITLANTGVQDVAGNAGTGSTDSNNYAIDNVRPSATIVVADNSLIVGETSAVTITFSEAVTGFTNADLTIANGTLSAVNSADGGMTWTATLTPAASTTDATNLITLANTGVQDVAGNAGTGSTDSNNYAIDNVRPTASIVVADNSLIVGETSAVTITFSEAVTGFSNADLTIANGTLSTVNSADAGTTWTATLTPTASTTDTTNLITLANTGVQDVAGNAGTGSTDSNNYAIDNVRPTASIVVADNSLIVGETSAVTITFSEAVTGFTNADLTIANGTLSAVNSADGGMTWTATLTPAASTTDATNLITLANTGVQDVAGNNGASTIDSNNYAIDTQPPIVTSVGVPINATYVAGQNLDFTVNLSEVVSVDTAGGTPRIAVTFDTGDIAYANYLSGSGTTALTFRAVVANGQLDRNGISLGSSIDPNGGAVHDSAGNDMVPTLNSVASTTGVVVDALAPVVSSIQLQGNPQPSAQSISFLVTFDEAVAHVDLSDFSLSTSGGISATISDLQQVDTQHWVVVINNITGAGGIRLDVKSATDITDQFGNALATGFNAGASFISQLPPSLITTAPLRSIAPAATGDSSTSLQSAPLIVLTSATTEIGGATNSGLISLVDSSSPMGFTSNDFNVRPIGSDSIGSSYILSMPDRSAPLDRIPGNSASVDSRSFEAGVPLFIPLPGVNAIDPSQQYSVEVRMQDGKPLVPWLHFDPETGLLHGEAPRDFNGTLRVQIIVHDDSGNSSVRVMELRFSDKAGTKEHRSGKEIPVHHRFIKDSQRSDLPGAAIGKPALADQFGFYGAGGRARDANALLSALNQLSAAPARADRS